MYKAYFQQLKQHLSVSVSILLLGRRDGINQTSIVDMSLVGLTTTAPLQKPSTTSMAPSSTTSLSPVEITETAEEEEESTDSSSMFSTSMAPPRPTPSGQEESWKVLEELLVATTVPPAAATTEETEGDDDAAITTTAATAEMGTLDFGTLDDSKSENDTRVESVPCVDIFPTAWATSAGALVSDAAATAHTGTDTEPLSVPTEEPDDHEVIEVGTVRPVVLLEPVATSAEPMFAIGKTEETIVEPGITTEMTGLDDTHTTDTAEATSEELVGFPPESTTMMPEMDWTAPPDYNPEDPFDYIDSAIHVEALPPIPPTQAVQEEPSGTTEPQHTMAPTETTTLYMCNTMPGTPTEQPPTPPTTGQDVETPVVVYEEEATMTTAPPTPPVTSSKMTAAPALIDDDSEPPGEDEVTTTASIQVFDESETRIPDSSARVPMGEEETVTAAIDAEYLPLTTEKQELDTG